MIIGILSDTHGDVDMTRRAVKLLLDRGAEYLIHCGDVGGEAVLDQMAGTPGAFVFGNNDFDGEDLKRYAQHLGLTCLEYGGVLTLDEKAIAVTHGDNQKEIQRWSVGADYLLTGHSHRQHDRSSGSIRWINPGALYRAAVKSVATLDLESDDLQWIEVPQE